MWIIPRACQKTIGNSILVEKLPIAFFGANLLGETHCLLCYLISCGFWWIHTSITVMKGAENPSNGKLQAQNCHAIMCLDNNEQNRYLSWGYLSHSLVIIENWNFRAIWRVYYFNGFRDIRAYSYYLANSITWVFSIMSDVATWIGTPKRLASVVLVELQQNSGNYIFTYLEWMWSVLGENSFLKELKPYTEMYIFTILHTIGNCVNIVYTIVEINILESCLISVLHFYQ